MNKIIEKKIGNIKFSLFSPEQVRRMSYCKVTIPDTYNDDGYPIDNGLVDPHMGVIDPGLKCKTCGARMGTCPGHFGNIELVRPAMHPEFAKIILFLLKSTCQECHRALVSNDDAKELRDKINESKEDQSQLRYSETKDVKTRLKAKIKTKCPHCAAEQDKISLLKPTTIYKGTVTMLPTEIREWLETISNDDLRVLGMDPLHARPEWMIMTVLQVPPVNMRPSITLDTGERSEDDLTHKLVDIMRINQRLEANINAGAPQLIIEDLWELLQYHVTTYFNNEMPNIPPARHRSGRPLKTLSQRLKGKEGRFRYNLSGKRVNFSARTVISPDPNISINEVGIPTAMAKGLTIPVKVTHWNMEACRTHMESEVYPRAIYAIKNDGRRVKLTESSREEILKDLVTGWTIERQLINGDTVLFNRQPSLHRMGMMCHNVKVLEGKTLRLNPAVCPPYNADFDGDEMNLHVIQSIEARVEAEMLMKVQDQIISPRHGHAIIKPEEDHVSGAFYLTFGDTTLNKSEACQLLIAAGITKMPKPDRKDKYSGKLLFSMLLPSDINVEKKGNFYSMDKNEGMVIIKDGLLISGGIESRVYQSDILESIYHKHGSDAAREFIDRSTRLVLAYLSLHGLTVSLKNYQLDDKAANELHKMIESTKREVDNVVVQYKNKTLVKTPGLTLKDTLEEKILMINGKAKKVAGTIVEKSFGITNPALVMGKIGARGSVINAISMSALVAQQSVRGKRLARGYMKRTLPHFRIGDLGAVPKGFIENSYMSGLTANEFFLQGMGGREALVNTAIRTGRSGYMQRRLINALQDLSVAADRSVRDADGSIVQFLYGGDGKDPQYSNFGKGNIEGPRKEDTETA